MCVKGASHVSSVCQVSQVCVKSVSSDCHVCVKGIGWEETQREVMWWCVRCVPNVCMSRMSSVGQVCVNCVSSV